MNYGQAKTEHESMRASAISGAEQCEVKQSQIFIATQHIETTLVVLTKDGETAVKFQTIYFPQQEAEK